MLISYLLAKHAPKTLLQTPNSLIDSSGNMGNRGLKANIFSPFKKTAEEVKVLRLQLLSSKLTLIDNPPDGKSILEEGRLYTLGL